VIASIAKQIAKIAIDNHITQIVIGESQQPRWKKLLKGSFRQRLMDLIRASVRLRETRKILEARAAEFCPRNLDPISVSSGHASVMVKPARLRESINVDHPAVVL
jgi:hypothetical protein